jgi:hypothetical protein
MVAGLKVSPARAGKVWDKRCGRNSDGPKSRVTPRKANRAVMAIVVGTVFIVIIVERF